MVLKLNILSFLTQHFTMPLIIMHEEICLLSFLLADY